MGTSMWEGPWVPVYGRGHEYQDMGGAMGTRIWEGPWVPAYGRGHGYQDMGGAMGTSIWEGPWVPAYGRGHGYQHMGGAMGTSIWEGPWVPTYGRGHGYQHMGGAMGTNIWEGPWVPAYGRGHGYQHMGGAMGTSIWEGPWVPTYGRGHGYQHMGGTITLTQATAQRLCSHSDRCCHILTLGTCSYLFYSNKTTPSNWPHPNKAYLGLSSSPSGSSPSSSPTQCGWFLLGGLAILLALVLLNGQVPRDGEASLNVLHQLLVVLQQWVGQGDRGTFNEWVWYRGGTYAVGVAHTCVGLTLLALCVILSRQVLMMGNTLRLHSA